MTAADERKTIRDLYPGPGPEWRPGGVLPRSRAKVDLLELGYSSEAAELILDGCPSCLADYYYPSPITILLGLPHDRR